MTTGKIRIIRKIDAAVNIRSSMSTQSDNIIGAITEDSVEATRTKYPDWYQVSENGYVMAKFFKEDTVKPKRDKGTE